ncbi:hypothetical protein PIB30_065439 [Stylosanthes scabra]|uniref:Uncharacterized protein n=1 Tax=Stylosanthes scabra TaxID=79078 RepID=A0ABU6UML9_9FABA|nr:hypothetical protein [Stylosanthes scabra]
MGSGVVFYEYEALKEYDDIDVEPTAELRTIKIQKKELTMLSHLPLTTTILSSTDGISMRSVPTARPSI